MIRYHPEIEDVIRPVGVAPLDLPTDDQITHTVADIVLAVNDEHYSVLYLGTGVCACMCVCNSAVCYGHTYSRGYAPHFSHFVIQSDSGNVCLLSLLNMGLFHAVTVVTFFYPL